MSFSFKEEIENIKEIKTYKMFSLFLSRFSRLDKNMIKVLELNVKVRANESIKRCYTLSL
ncbi:hypothetical protein YN1HA_19080 [Sulfurisphaera ohwakuensis]